MTVAIAPTRSKVDGDLVSLAVAGLSERSRIHYRSYYNSYALFRNAASANAALHELLGMTRDEALLLFEDYRAHLRKLGRSAHAISDHMSALRRAIRHAKRAGRTVLNVERKRPRQSRSLQSCQPQETLSLPALTLSVIPIATFREEVLRLYKPPLMSRASYRFMRDAFQTLAERGFVSTADLTPEAVQNLEASWPGSDEKRRLFRNSLHRICSLAIERHCMPFNPVPQTQAPYKKPASKRKALLSRRGTIPTVAEVKRLLTYLSGRADTWTGFRLYALVATAVYMDFFHSEAVYLRPDDCDLRRSIITLNHGRRSPLVLRIPSELLPVLVAWLPWAGSHYLFPGRAKVSPWTSDTGPCGVNGQIREAGLAIGIDGLTFESLRRCRLDDPSVSPLIEPGSKRNVWVIMGDRMAPLADHVQALVEEITIAWNDGERKLSQAELEAINCDARRIIREELEPSHRRWLEIMDRPRQAGKRGGYGWKDPRRAQLNEGTLIS